MFRTLRSKLIFSHFAVIFVAFVLTILIASVPVRRAQEARIEDQLRASAQTVARLVELGRQFSSRQGGEPDAAAVDLVRRLLRGEQPRNPGRILLSRADGLVILDSRPGSPLQGRRLPQIAAGVEALQATSSQQSGTPPGQIGAALETESVPIADIEDLEAVVATSRATLVSDAPGLYIVALAPSPRAPVLDDVVRPLLVAAAIALLVSFLIALLISRSVSRPVSRLTAAASRISAGNLDQRVETSASGELGALVSTFNAMLDRLEATYRSQRDLLANIAHELRTPLTSIQGYAQALREGVISDGERRDDALLAIDEESIRIGDLVNQILQLSRLESGQIPIARDPVAISQLTERLRGQFQLRADDSGIALSIEEPPNLAVTGDAELLLQALGNLVSNALRHTPPGGIVSVRAARVVTTTGQAIARLTVTDTGEGIPREQLALIFERFYRAVGEPAVAEPGRFGLGLSIVRQVIELHHGTVAVESAPGRGTTFTIDLPLDPPD